MKRIVAAVALVLAASSLAALAGPPRAPAETALPMELRILSSQTLSGTAGDFVEVAGEIANTGRGALDSVTTYLSLVNTDTRMPVDLEDWSAERGLFIGSIDAGQTFPLTWKIHFVQSGNYALAIVADVEGCGQPTISALTYFKVVAKRNLNPGHVLPVALGEPILLIFGFLLLWYWRDRRSRR
jgi:hypothetical protein